MIDTHSHLFEEDFDIDRDDCVKRCKEFNINKVIIVGFDYYTNRKAQEMAKKYDIFYPTAGIHPEYANKDYNEKFNELKDFIKNNKVYAIGECGLDYYWSVEFKEEQKILFEMQINLAIENDLPIIIHCRDAIKDTYDILSKYKGRIKGVMHCYSGSLEMAYEFIKLGLYISLGGPVTFKNAKEPKRVAKNISIDNLLIETDCPFLTPVPYRGKRNESSYVRFVCDEIAKIKGMTSKEVEDITEANAIKLFRI